MVAVNGLNINSIISSLTGSTSSSSTINGVKVSFSNSSALGDLTSLSLSELKEKKSVLTLQQKSAAETYPELKAQYTLMIKKIDKEIAKKEAWLNVPTDQNVIKKLTTTDNSELTLQQLKDKKALLNAQMLEAVENYPELGTQYKTKIAEVDKLITEKSKTQSTSSSNSLLNLLGSLINNGSSNSIMMLLFSMLLNGYSNK